MRTLPKPPLSPVPLSALIRSSQITAVRVWPTEPDISTILSAANHAFGVNKDEIRLARAGGWQYPLTRSCIAIARYTTSLTLQRIATHFQYDPSSIVTIVDRVKEDLDLKHPSLDDIFDRVCAELDTNYRFSDGPTTVALHNRFTSPRRTKARTTILNGTVEPTE